MKRVCVRLIRMNPIIGQPFIGCDIDGKQVAGTVLHSGACDKATQQPTTYVIQRYPQNGRRHGGYAIISAQAIHQHLTDLALVASMEKDNE